MPAEGRNHGQDRLLVHRDSGYGIQKDCSHAAGGLLQGRSKSRPFLIARDGNLSKSKSVKERLQKDCCAVPSSIQNCFVPRIVLVNRHYPHQDVQSPHVSDHNHRLVQQNNCRLGVSR